MSPEGLAGDLAEVVRRLEEVHPDLVAELGPERWATARAEALTALQRADDPAGFWWAVAPLAAAGRDGHTALWPPNPEHPAPWALEVRADGAWITGWGGQAGPPLPAEGARLVSVEGIPAERLWAALAERYGGETDGFVRWRLGVEAWRALPLAVEALGGEVEGVWHLVLERGGRAGEALVVELPRRSERGRGWLNVWFAEDPSRGPWPAPTSPGVLVEHVLPGGAADRAGLRSGDLVVAVDGAPTPTLEVLHAALATRRRGEDVVVDALRDGAALRLPVRAGRWRPWPAEWSFTWAEDALVVDLDAFHDAPAFREAFGAALAARPVAKVVVDLRGNDGGDAQMPELLCERLCRTAPAGLEMVWRHSREAHRDQRRAWGVLGLPADLLSPRGTFLGSPVGDRWRWRPDPVPLAAERFDGAVDVLVDGGTFSAGVYAAHLLRDHAGARVVGEPPGSGPSFHAHTWTDALRATGLRLQVATATFRVLGTPGPVVPDVAVPSRDALRTALGRAR